MEREILRSREKSNVLQQPGAAGRTPECEPDVRVSGVSLKQTAQVPLQVKHPLGEHKLGVTETRLSADGKYTQKFQKRFAWLAEPRHWPWGSVARRSGGEGCRGGAAATRQTSELTPSQLHSSR
ncbi:hypothetical protein EYF80_029689 [Liparis tanakae]|uniref:Uncharacterized protein n=1 Tax=Liparis tanakae TaxID=230148 RepID=A0A4Z2H2M4_9TELE|nr:hypothetical protein EYF80_029689 [Liparis tanakae]